jgi:protein-disulfide isomerase
VRYAADLGLDVKQFREDLRRHVGAGRIADDIDSAGLSGVAGTPTFFINGRRQYGAYDIDTLTAAVRRQRPRRGSICQIVRQPDACIRAFSLVS